MICSGFGKAIVGTPEGIIILRALKAQPIDERLEDTFRKAMLRALEIRHLGYPEGVQEAAEAIRDPKQLESLQEIEIRSNSLEAFPKKL